MRDMTECGTTCLAMIFKHYGLVNIQAALREIAGVTAYGTDLLTLSRVAERFGFQTQGVRTKFEYLRRVSLPCIAHYEGNHYVVVYKADAESVWVANPASGKEKMSRSEFAQKWNGILLLVEPSGDTSAMRDSAELAEQYASRSHEAQRGFYRSLLAPFRRQIAAVAGVSLLLVILSLALPFFTQSVIDSVLVLQNKNLLYALLLAMVIVFVMQVALTYTRHLLMARLRVNFEFEFFSRFFRRMLHLPQPYFDAHKREDFIQRFQENVKVRNILNAGTVQSLLDVSLLVVLIPVMFLYNAELAVIGSASLVVFILTTIAFTPRIRRLQEKVFYENARTMGAFVDTLLGMTTIKLLAAETLKYWQWRATYKRTLGNTFTASRTQIMMSSLMRTVMLLGQVSVYWYGAYITFGGGMTIGQYIAFLTLFGIILNAASSISDVWFVMTDAAVTLARLNDVFEQEPEHADIAGQTTALADGGIEFRNVWFSYDGSEHHALSDISFSVAPGERIGIVGRNGSGKTTLVKLLVKFYEHYKGSIHIGSAELRSYHPQYLRMGVYMLPQHVYVFNGSIADNIRAAKPDAPMEDVIRAAKLADLHEFIGSLYLGYNHKIGESGSDLSGGQRLKLAFARLFLSQPEIIILDEASSALDVIAEQRIMKNVYEVFAGKTVISIAHRLSTLQHVDRIIMLDDGRILEQGTHDELVAKRGGYHTFITTYVG